MRALAYAVLALVGCVPGEVDLHEKACPCTAGWFCEMPARICKRGIAPGADGGAADAARADGGGHDAGEDPMDGGPRDSDAGAADGGPADTDDAGPADAGPDDAGVGGTRCDDIHAGAIFCDGFEAIGDFPGWTSSYELDAMMERSTVRTFVGLGSLHVAQIAPGGQARVRFELPSPIVSGDLYARLWIYLPSGFAIVETLNLVTVGYQDSPWYQFSIRIGVGGEAVLFTEAEAAERSIAGPIVPRDAWVCLEAHVTISDTAGVADLWMDGTPAGRLVALDTRPALGYARVSAGLHTTAPQASAEVYTDEVVLSHSRIGCD